MKGVVLLLVVASLGAAMAQNTNDCGTGNYKIPKGWTLGYKVDNACSTCHVPVPVVKGPNDPNLDANTVRFYTDNTIEFKVSFGVTNNINQFQFNLVWSPPLPGAELNQWSLDKSRGTYAGQGEVTDWDSPAAIYQVTITSAVCKTGETGLYSFQWGTRLPADNSWSYTDTQAQYVACVQIPQNNPPDEWAGLDVYYQISPDLPAGLFFLDSYGWIVGLSYEPTDTNHDGIAESTQYTVTATNVYAESTTSTLYIQVNPTQPRALWYWLHKVIDVTRGRKMVDFNPKWKCSKPNDWTITPALPAGLSFDANHGRIHGTPSVITNRVKYVITGKNDIGSATTFVRLRVWEAPPYLLRRLGWKACSGPNNC